MDGTTPRQTNEGEEHARDHLLIVLSQSVMAQGARIAALEGRLMIVEAELVDFRALADVFARFIGEAKS